MTKLLLASLKIEYETTNISIDSLCEKHSTTTSELKGYTNWKKMPGLKEHKEVPETITQSIVIPPAPVAMLQEEEELKKPTIAIPQEKKAPEKTTAELESDIFDFKVKAIKLAINFIEEDARFAEVKEFKDMVGIVDAIDKSLQKNTNDQGPTINILVQNLAERYQDDC